MLKHHVLALLLAALVCTAAASAVAQDNGNNGGSDQAAPSGQQQGHRHFDPEKRTEMLTKQLNLTSDQQPKVLEILKSQQSQMEGLRSDSSLSQDDRRSKMMDIRKSSNDQIRTLLDPDQQKKWDKMEARRGEWMQGNHGGQAPAASDSSEQK